MPPLAAIATDTANAGLPQNAERVWLATGIIAVPRDVTFAMIVGQADASLPAGTTGMTLRIRRGVDTTGGIVRATSVVTGGITASAPTLLTLMAIDTLLGLATVQYCFSGQTTGAAGASSGTREDLFVLLF